MIDLGEVAYAAYCVSCGGQSIRGEQLPIWVGLPPEIREHWRAAADGVRMMIALGGPDEGLTTEAGRRHETCPQCPWCGKHRHGGPCSE